MIHFQDRFCIKIMRNYRNYYIVAKIVKELKVKLILIIAKITKINIIPANARNNFCFMNNG